MIATNPVSLLVCTVFNGILEREKILLKKEKGKQRYIEKKLKEDPQWMPREKKEVTDDELRQRRREKERNQITRRIRYIRKGAKRRGIPCTITGDELEDIMKRPCIYYNFMPKRGFNGVDRRDNANGYCVENLDPSCYWCNRMKSTSDLVSYLEQCMHIDHYQRTRELLFPDCFGKPAGFTQYKVCKRSDKKRGWVCTLKKDDLARIFRQTCVFSGLSATTVDRIDKSKPHTRDNVQPSIFACNLMRWDYTCEEFLAHCAQIVRHATETNLLDRLRAMNIPRIFEKKKSMCASSECNG